MQVETPVARAPMFCLILSAAALPQAARAADPDYLGAWQIAEARSAPWIKSEAEVFAKERQALVGQRVVFAVRRIDGPAPLACDKPAYEMLDVPPEMLFQGGLTAPAEQAAALGFASRTIPTLQTGCEGWIDFHFTDERTAEFALNNTIYVLRRR